MAPYQDIFKIRHNNQSPEKGRILISEPFLQDNFFQRSVILLVEHNADGSMGFVLNKKTGLLLNLLMDGLTELPNIPIYLGGPVSPGNLFYIHSLGDIIPGSIPINDNLYLDGDFESLNYYLLSGGPVHGKIKFFIGYSGWTANQLNEEINQDSWLVSKAANRQIMLADGESFWKKSVEVVGGTFLTWLNYPKNPLLN